MKSFVLACIFVAGCNASTPAPPKLDPQLAGAWRLKCGNQPPIALDYAIGKSRQHMCIWHHRWLAHCYSHV